jgi:LuxR family maltose regulon positive regulatory protein
VRVITKKLVVPPSPVARARLVRLLDGALSRPLTLVTAPDGSGKTTLAATWLRTVSPATAWLSLDEDDDVPGRFLECLVAALEPEGAARTLLEAGSASMPAVVAELVNGLAAEGTELVAVLDDVHLLREPGILDALTFLVEHCPPGLHLVFACRDEPGLPLSRWRGRGGFAEIGAAQLRFSAEEAAALLDTLTGRDVDPAVATALYRRADGWAAGVQMLGIGLRDGTAAPGPAVSHRYVLDHLAGEVLSGQPADVRDFLLRTSVLDELTPSLCDAVTGRTDSDRVIRRLERANLFLTPVDESGEWHRYHGLFADYLRGELPPDVAAESHRRAADWYSFRDFPAETVRHAMAGGDLGLAIGIVRSVAEDQVRRGELVSLLSLLDRLPDGVIRGYADLAGFKGWLLYLAGRIDEAESYARTADAAMPADAPVSDRAMLMTFQAHLALTRGDPGRASELAADALTLLGDSTPFFRAAAMGVLGRARSLTGDRRGAAPALRHSEGGRTDPARDRR